MLILKTLDWPQEESEAAGEPATTQHLWEESWDDDDTSDDFSAQLRYGTVAIPPLPLLQSSLGKLLASVDTSTYYTLFHRSTTER